MSNIDIRKIVNKIIVSLTLTDKALVLVMADGTVTKLYDDAQTCCEYRYFQTDDTLDDFIGSTLIDIDISNAPDIEMEDGIHEISFLRVVTSRGVFTIDAHNEHNGYYGGFAIECQILKKGYPRLRACSTDPGQTVGG